MPSYLFIVNPKARNGIVARKWKQIELLIQAEELSYEVKYTEYSRHAIELAHDYGKDFDAIVAVGGDGTVHEVANGIVDLDVSFAAFPVGNGNDYAHLLNYPSDYKEIIKVLKDFKTVQLPVGIVKGTEKRYFVNIAESGITAIISKAAFSEATWLRGWVKYYYIALKKLFRYKNVPATVKVDDQFELNVNLILCAVGLGYRFGGGFKVLPDNHPLKGDFAICIAGDVAKLRQLYLINKLKQGKHLNRKGIWFTRGKNVVVSLERPLPVEAEGEIVGEETDSIKISYGSKKLNVIVPKTFVK